MTRTRHACVTSLVRERAEINFFELRTRACADDPRTPRPTPKALVAHRRTNSSRVNDSSFLRAGSYLLWAPRHAKNFVLAAKQLLGGGTPSNSVWATEKNVETQTGRREIFRHEKNFTCALEDIKGRKKRHATSSFARFMYLYYKFALVLVLPRVQLTIFVSLIFW